MKKNVLFVDDEINILNALKRMLFHLKNEWQMYFANSGYKALEILETTKVDVVVTDMRMPGMDGAQLLEEIQKKYPEMIRIVLSGHSDKADIMRTVNLAHQFLSKPCSSDKIKETVNNTFELHKILKNDDAQRMVSKIESLPSLPGVYRRVKEEMDSDDYSLASIGGIISEDIGMSTNVLKLVNSSFFGLTNHVSSPTQAVNMLGVEIIESLMLSSHIFHSLNLDKIEGMSIDKLMDHSLLTGNFAKLIAKHEKVDKKIVDNSFIAGMLHDVGKLILISNFNVTYKVVIAEAQAQNKTIWEVETEVLGTTHAEIGAYLLGLWGLSDNIVEAVALHHTPNYTGSEGFTPLMATHFANVLEHDMVVLNKEYASHDMDIDYINRFDCQDKIEQWREVCKKYMKRVDDE